MSSQSARIVVKVRFDQDIYYALREFSAIHFSSRNKIINAAVADWIKAQRKK